MWITFDSAKDARNVAERGLSFEGVAELDWETAFAVEDTWKDCGERRLRVLAMLGARLHVAVVTRRGAALHVISFRKANRREVRLYGESRKQAGISP